MENRKAILLLSGGIDSTTLLAQLSKDGRHIYALSFDYGQKHKIELDLARRNAQQYGVAHHATIRIDNQLFALKSSLTNEEIMVPRYETGDVIKEATDVVVPSRNLMFLSQAAAYAESLDCPQIYIAYNKDDRRHFKDCRPTFISSLNRVLSQQSELKKKPRILTPFLDLTKAHVIERAMELGVDLSQTITCYQPSGMVECGECLSCRTKQKALNDIKRNQVIARSSTHSSGPKK